MTVFDEIRAVLEKHKDHIPVVATAELLAVIDGTEEKQKVFDADAVFKKMWRESEEVCGNTMIELERVIEIIQEELSGGVIDGT